MTPDPTSLPLPAPLSTAHHSVALKKERVIVTLRKLIWLYFWLLLFEGAFRKWILPSAANLILLIRDPLVLYIYTVAFASNILRWRPLFTATGVIAFLLFMGGMFALPDGFPTVLYGLRTNFLHLPLALLIAEIFDKREVVRVGRILLILSFPMAILMAFQFVAPPNAWINAGADESFVQISTARGHIRPPGTFSYIAGPIGLFSLVAVYLTYTFFFERTYSLRLTLFASIGLLLAMVVSGSRGLVAAVGVVVAFGVLGTLFYRGDSLRRMTTSLMALVALGSVLSFIPVVQEGFAALGERFGDKSEFQDGFIMREYRTFVPDLGEWYTIPQWGFGLGRGTKVGQQLYTGTRQGYDVGEEEIIRNFYESGIILGLVFVLFRYVLGLSLLRLAYQQCKEKNALPWAFCGVCVINIMTAQIGQPSILGFTVISAGMCLAMINKPTSDTDRSKVVAYLSGKRR